MSHYAVGVIALTTKTSAISAIAAPMTNSGESFGPLVSASKNLTIPRLLLGPLIAGPLFNLTISKHQKMRQNEHNIKILIVVKI